MCLCCVQLVARRGICYVSTSFVRVVYCDYMPREKKIKLLNQRIHIPTFHHWALCIRRTLCRHVTIGTRQSVPILMTKSLKFFGVLTVFDCFWRLMHCWYTVGTVLYSLGRPVTIGAPMVLTVFDDWYSVPVYQSSKTVKNSQKTVKTAKITIGVPIVTCLHRVRRIDKVRVRIRVRRIHKAHHCVLGLKQHKRGRWILLIKPKNKAVKCADAAVAVV